MRMTLGRERHFVYRAFDADGRALYVGCTSNLKARMAQHRSRAEWPRLVADLVVTEYPGRRWAFAAERAEIQRLDPVYNVVHRHPLSVGVQRAIAAGELPAEPTPAELEAWIETLPTERPRRSA